MKILDPQLLKQFRGPGVCEGCGRYCESREAHHILAKGIGNGRQIDHILNLVGLGDAWGCNCHGRHHNGDKPTTAYLWAVVDKREKVPPGTAEAKINEIRRL